MPYQMIYVYFAQLPAKSQIDRRRYVYGESDFKIQLEHEGDGNLNKTIEENLSAIFFLIKILGAKANMAKLLTPSCWPAWGPITGP